MLINYLKIAFRSIRRNLRYVILNVLGLSFGLGFGIMAFQNYRYAHSYDGWHTQGNRILRIESRKADNDALYGACPSRLAITAPQQLAAVETAVRFDSKQVVVKQGENIFTETVHFADPAFFRLFDFTVISGAADLTNPAQVLISEETATKYFGRQNPIGKTLTLYADQATPHPLRVSGILASNSKHSGIRFHLLTNLSNEWEQNKPVDFTDWKTQVDAVFLLLKQPTAAATVAQQLQPFVQQQQTADPDWKIKQFLVEPLFEMGKHGRTLRRNRLPSALPPPAIWAPLVMAALILLTAILNFANMTIAIGNGRLREIGVRKVMGSKQVQLVGQLLAEAGIVCGCAVLVGMILAFPITSWFNNLWSYTDIVVDYTDPTLLGFVMGMLVLTTLLAGFYPAFYVSSFHAASILRGTLRFGGSGFFSQLMMGLQVIISLLSVIIGLGFQRNAEYNRTADVGYDRHNILGANVYDESNARVFQETIRSIPHVEAVGSTQHVPGVSLTSAVVTLNSQPHEITLFNIGNQFINLFQISLLAGQPLLPSQGNQPEQTVLVNETFARTFGEGKPLIGQSITLDSATYRIGGVVRDFLIYNPFTPISPVVLRPTAASQHTYVIARVPALYQKQVFEALEKAWKRLYPYKPFAGFYADNALAEAEAVSTTIARVMGVFALLSVILAISGLYSLISLNVLKRLREVAIRRVLGATDAQIGWILHKRYRWVVALSVLIGSAGGYYLGGIFLNSLFKLNNGISYTILAASAVSILVIICLTILLRLWKTLQLDPVQTLKME